MKCGLVNVKICEDKTRGLMREMQGFQLPPTDDIKACLPPFKRLSRPFSECVTELIASLGSESPQCSPPPPRSPSYVTSKQADTIKSELENALPSLREEAYASEQAAVGRHEARLRAAISNLPEDPFLGPHNLLSIAPAVRAEEVQDILGARFCAANYHEQYLIMRGVLRGEMARYETMAYECWDRVDDIKEKIKDLEEIEAKKQRMREVLMQSRAEIPVLESKVQATQKRVNVGHDRSPNPPPPAKSVASPGDQQLAGGSSIGSVDTAKARYQAEKAVKNGDGGSAADEDSKAKFPV